MKMFTYKIGICALRFEGECLAFCKELRGVEHTDIATKGLHKPGGRLSKT